MDHSCPIIAFHSLTASPLCTLSYNPKITFNIFVESRRLCFLHTNKSLFYSPNCHFLSLLKTFSNISDVTD